MSECWKQIPIAYEGYEASSFGRIRSPRRVLAQALNTDEYPVVCIKLADGSFCTKTVHGLVAEAFHGQRPQKLEIAHLNHVKSDARPENLEYQTKMQNNNGGHPLTAPCWLPWDKIEVGESFVSSSNPTQARNLIVRASSRYQKAFTVRRIGKSHSEVTRTPMLGAMTCAATAEIGGGE